jgi:hypothetical protein
VVFALGEMIIFSFIFGIDRGWEEITRGADLKVPRMFRFVIKYITPTFILVIFVAALIKPENDWGAAFGSLFSGHGWPLAPDSVIGKVTHVGVEHYSWFDESGRATTGFVRDITRMLLIIVFVLCCFLVWRAWRLKARRAS